jgi:hypothetical protein
MALRFGASGSTVPVKGSMLITIFATRFLGGSWKDWEHSCNEEEVEAVADSAKVKADERIPRETPTLADYLDGARYIFNVAFGPPQSPSEGDTNVYGVLVNDVVIARFEQLREHFALRLTA